MKRNVLLINGSGEHYWLQVLQEALTSLGALQMANEAEAKELVLKEAYDIIIVDATVIEDAARMVAHLRAKQAEAKIIVVTASPTWRRARAAFRAGANDYIRKSRRVAEVRAALEEL